VAAIPDEWIDAKAQRCGGRKEGCPATVSGAVMKSVDSAARCKFLKVAIDALAPSSLRGQTRRVDAPNLSGKQRRALRALAHALNPTVQVGRAGVTDAVIGAVSVALATHELIKVRLQEPEDKHGSAETLAHATGAALCGVVGHTVILYRPHPEHPRIQV
jgi:RNA-binding protein